jgi:hypothetical protein
MARDVSKADVASDVNTKAAEAQSAESIALAVPSDSARPPGQSSSEAQDVVAVQALSEHAIQTLSASQIKALSVAKS